MSNLTVFARLSSWQWFANGEYIRFVTLLVHNPMKQQLFTLSGHILFPNPKHDYKISSIEN